MGENPGDSTVTVDDDDEDDDEDDDCAIAEGFFGSSSDGKTRKFENDFEILEELGRGSYGKVLKVRHKVDKRCYALKIVRLPEDEVKRERALRECRNLAQVNHPGIVRYQHSWIETGDPGEMPLSESESSESRSSEMSAGSEDGGGGSGFTCLFIQMELCGETLNDYLDKISDNGDPHERLSKHLNIFLGLVDALAYMHDQGLIHRDLKPDNVFRSLEYSDKFKIGDWGSVKGEHVEEEDDRVFTSYSDYFGTQGYLAPEIEKKAAYDAKIDVYALGNILLHLVCPKITAQEFSITRSRIVDQGFNPGIWPHSLYAMLRSCFMRQAALRLSTQQLKMKVREAMAEVDKVMKMERTIGAYRGSTKNVTLREKVKEGEDSLRENAEIMHKLCLRGGHGTQKTQVALEIGSGYRKEGYMVIVTDLSHALDQRDVQSEILKSLNHPVTEKDAPLPSLDGTVWGDIVCAGDVKLFWILRNCTPDKLNLFVSSFDPIPIIWDDQFPSVKFVMTSIDSLPFPSLHFPGESSIITSLRAMLPAVVNSEWSAHDLLQLLAVNEQKIIFLLSLLPCYQVGDRVLLQILDKLGLRNAFRPFLVKLKASKVLTQSASGTEYLLHWYLKVIISDCISNHCEEVMTALVKVTIKVLVKRCVAYWSKNGSLTPQCKSERFYFLDLMCELVKNGECDFAFSDWSNMNPIVFYHAVCYLGVHSIRSYDMVLEGFLRISELYSKGQSNMSSIIGLMMADHDRRSGKFDEAMQKVNEQVISKGGSVGASYANAAAQPHKLGKRNIHAYSSEKHYYFVESFKFYLTGRILNEQMEGTVDKSEDILSSFAHASELFARLMQSIAAKKGKTGGDFYKANRLKLIESKAYAIFLAKAYHLQKAKQDYDSQTPLGGVIPDLETFLNVASNHLGQHVTVARCWRDYGDLKLLKKDFLFANRTYENASLCLKGSPQSRQQNPMQEQDEVEYMKLLRNWGKSKCLSGDIEEGLQCFMECHNILEKRCSLESRYGFQLYIRQSEAFYRLYMEMGLKGLKIARNMNFLSQEGFQRRLNHLLGPSVVEGTSRQTYRDEALKDPAFRRAMCKSNPCENGDCVDAHVQEEKRN